MDKTEDEELSRNLAPRGDLASALIWLAMGFFVIDMLIWAGFEAQMRYCERGNPVSVSISRKLDR